VTIVPYVPDPAEDAEITAMRERHATRVRAWARKYVNSPDVSDIDFAHSLHRFTYDQARTLAQRAIEIHRENGGPW
jgi:hypothetical protein